MANMDRIGLGTTLFHQLDTDDHLDKSQLALKYRSCRTGHAGDRTHVFFATVLPDSPVGTSAWPR